MPVLAVIHSSLVSTIFSRSALVKTLSGTAAPVPVILARIINSTLAGCQIFGGLPLLHVNGKIFLQLLGNLLIYPFLHIVVGKTYGVLDRLGIGSAMAYHPHTINAQKGSAAVFGVIHFLFEIDKGLAGQEIAQSGEKTPLDFFPEHLADRLGQTLGELQHHVADE